MRARHVVLAFLLPLSACTVVGHERVDGWPELRVVEHHVPHHAMRERCARYTHWTMSPEACAEFHLAAGECHLWFSVDFPPPPDVVAHERLHCQGYDHVGQGAMATFLADYLAAQQASVGASPPATLSESKKAGE